MPRMTDQAMKPVHVIGGGMAGSEATWQLVSRGVPVILHEMRGVKGTDAHKTDGLAELVCSNSFRSDDHRTNAVGLLHEEMRRLNSIILTEGDRNRLPAGGALAVDRDTFSQAVTKTLSEHPLVTIERGEITGLPPEDWDSVIIATGPLTSESLSSAILETTGEGELAFFDAIAPVIHRESVNLDKAWFQSRYDKGETEAEKKAYLNCPMDKEQYEAFIDALLAAPKTEFKEWEANTPYFDGCLPIEVMAERGRETLRHGPMKPVGLTNPHNPTVKPWAIVQLRQDNALGTLFNMVGFQTKMKYGAQTEIFRMIPGLEEAQFARLGEDLAPPPPTTALGALLAHVTGGHLDGGKGSFQPMNVNFGLFPPIAQPTHDADGNRIKGKAKTPARKMALSARALTDLAAWSKR
jgi:methylenetetrahydrofolate--tRNA-(uracil-5-)-methyltransferase